MKQGIVTIWAITELWGKNKLGTLNQNQFLQIESSDFLQNSIFDEISAKLVPRTHVTPTSTPLEPTLNPL